jgi:hypothetical protein
MRRAIVGAALAAMTVGLMSGPALAGEITGNGKPTPINSYQAGSICSFSGLNDVPDDPIEGGKVQNWATAFKAGIQEEGVTVSEAARAGLLLEFGPGTPCRGYASAG